MPTLKELFTKQRAAVIDDCVVLLDAEVSSKSGLSGLAIKAGYSVVKGIKPTFIRDTLDRLMDEFADKLDPIYQEAKTANKPVAQAFVHNAARAAEQLLQITDGRAKKPGQSGAVTKTYDKLRPSAKDHVMAAMPALGRLVEKYDEKGE